MLWTIMCQMALEDGAVMLVKTMVFKLSDSRYNNLRELADAMGISVSQIYRVRQGKRNINQKFIIGAMKAFPGYRFDDLFYLSPDNQTAAIAAITGAAGQPTAQEKQGIEKRRHI